MQNECMTFTFGSSDVYALVSVCAILIADLLRIFSGVATGNTDCADPIRNRVLLRMRFPHLRSCKPNEQNEGHGCTGSKVKL